MYYTKYRPQKFSEIQRPNEIADALMQQIKNSKTAHAYLFTGPKGVGKTTMARLLAKAHSCKALTKDGDVCGKCSFCVSVQTGSLIDLIEIDAASNRGIDDMRDLREKIKLLPVEGKKKVYIIDEVHMLTNEAFNALLKTLEEPPAHAVFILCTTEFHKVPETIKSRCQIFKFKRPTRLQIIEKLKRIANSEAEKLEIPNVELERIAVMAGGAFRDAENLLQQLIDGGKKTFDTTDSEGFLQFLSNIYANTPTESLKYVSNLFENGSDLTVWTDGLIRYLRDVLYIKMGFSADYFDMDSNFYDDRRGLAESVSLEWLIKALEVFNEAFQNLKVYSLPQLALDLAVVKLSNTNSPQEEVTSPSSLPENYSSGPGSKIIVHPKSKKTEESAVPLTKVEEQWKEIVKKVTSVNGSVGALVKSGKPAQVEENIIVLEVAYKFHKERLESAINKRMVENALEEVFNQRLSLKCNVCEREKVKKDEKEEDLTDLNVRIPQNIKIDGSTSVVDVFDGGLPL